MQIVHISAESSVNIISSLNRIMPGLISKLPDKFGMVAVAQFISQLGKANEFFGKNKKTAVVYGQILGCKVPNIKEDVVFYIGDGEFHPKGILLLDPAKKVIAFNPFSGELREFAKKDIEQIEKRKKGALIKFLSSNTIGVLLSVKSGQSSVQGNADLIRQNLEKKYPDKKFYYFACETLDLNELENFPFVEVWVNTMCPRLGHDDTIRISRAMINYIDLINL